MMKRKIAVSQKKERADLIITNVQVADVFNLRWKKANIVIADRHIIAIDENNEFEAEETLNGKGKYAIPGLIDAHIHIESSMLTPYEFSRILVPHGVTTVVTDPHEIANVSGKDGLRFMIEDAKHAQMDILYMLPSSVPGTTFENAGAVLTAEDLAEFVTEPSILGLAEVMDYPSVLNGEDHILDKIKLAQAHHMKIDGHAAGLNSEQIRGYRAAGIETDHECVTADEAMDRIEQGMYVLIREGSAAKNLKALIPAINAANARRFAFCTDDKHLDELMEEGSINHSVSMAIAEGVEPLQAIQIATLNAAECYQLKNKGALASGFIADIVLVDDVTKMNATTVLKDGQVVAKDGVMCEEPVNTGDPKHSIVHSVHIPKVKKSQLAIPFKYGNTANIIEIMPDQITTKKKVANVDVQDGVFVQSIEKDFLKLAVVERHHNLGNIGLAIVHGCGLKEGAVATTIAHDSHNAIVIGANDDDMIKALEALQTMQGGLVVVRNGEVIGALNLPIAGLMTNEPAKVVVPKLEKVHAALHDIHPTLSYHFFLTLSFLSLPVIPELKLTDTGLFDVVQFKHIETEVNT